jgi:hypothetical protein
MQKNLLFLLVFAIVAGLFSFAFALTFYEVRENRKSFIPPLDGLTVLNDQLDLGDVPQDILTKDLIQ